MGKDGSPSRPILDWSHAEMSEIRISALQARGIQAINRAFMSSIFNNDIFWSFFAMPIGLMICFSPIMLVWALEGFGDKDASKK